MTQQAKSRYLEYLPAIYHEDPFLGQFLLPFEKVLTGFEDLLSTVDRYFSPALTDPDFLPWLSSWVVLVLDEEWGEARQRQLIAEAVELYRWRGTMRGLKRYLEIYTGLEPSIAERRWPGGMQIGVASRIGGTQPPSAFLGRIERVTRAEPTRCDDYYFVDTVDAEGNHIQKCYRASKVVQVEIEDEYVDIQYFPPDSTEVVHEHHEPATITRRDGLIDDRYTLVIDRNTAVEYAGDTVLIDQVELPYRFIVDVQVPLADVAKVKLDKVRAIIDLEKPAHTVYYLKLTPVASKYVLEPLQVGVRSTIGLSTTVG